MLLFNQKLSEIMQTEDEYEMAYLHGYSDCQKAIDMCNNRWMRVAACVSLFFLGFVLGWMLI